MEHMGWHRRGYLPHCDYAGNLQAITFRLADSLPATAVSRWKEKLQKGLDSEDGNLQRQAESILHRRMAAYEDSGYGACLLRLPACAEVVQQALIENHGSHYHLIDWCIMPNHVHALIRGHEAHPLSKIAQRWKGTTAIQINRLVNREGRLWMPDYHDRLIRDEDHFYNSRTYIRQNPVKAGLCADAREWPFSSCRLNWNPDS